MFIPDFLKTVIPLSSQSKKGYGVQKWNEECDKEFQTLNDAIKNALVLVAQYWLKPIRGHIRVSERSVEANLTPLGENVKYILIDYFSEKLSFKDLNDTENDTKLLGLIRFL